MSYELLAAVAVVAMFAVQLLALGFIIYHATHRVTPGEAALLLRSFQQSTAIAALSDKVDDVQHLPLRGRA